MLHHDGCYGVPHLSGVVRQEGSLDRHSWQVILMSSISPIRPVINNSISARPTQTDKCNTSTRGHTLTHSQGLRGTNEKGNGCISGWLPCLWFQGGVCPCALRSAVHCWLLPGHSKLYHLLSLVKHRLRIWKAVTKFIWEEWEQIAWSRCYKGDKTKVAPSRGSASVHIGTCFTPCVSARPKCSGLFFFFSSLAIVNGKWHKGEKRARTRKSLQSRGEM